MRKKFGLLILLLFSLLFLLGNVSAKTESLKTLKEQLAKDEAKLNASLREQEALKQKILNIKDDINSTSKEINKFNDEIEISKSKIEELNLDIEAKKKEIDNLVSFMQISDGDNIYLEYIFGAQNFADFIYRSAVIEQLTDYNNDLVNDMYAKIEENKQLQADLKNKIIASEKAVDNLEATLKKSNLSMDDLISDHKDIKADYLASKEEVETYEALYKKYKCKETDSIVSCLSTPYASGFIRPVTRGSITSEYGMRLHPTLGYYRMHNGLDIGVPMGTNVYASAAGVVVKITKVANPNKKNSSCGGNMVYIRHNVGGTTYRTVYMHLHTIKVKVNDIVTKNTIIGTSGGGESYDYCTTGPHLHFGVLKGASGSTYLNPRNYVNFPKKGVKFSSRY